jgi:hypothetical protein
MSQKPQYSRLSTFIGNWWPTAVVAIALLGWLATAARGQVVHCGALQSGDPLVLQGKMLVSDASLRLPKVEFLTIRFRQHWIAPTATKRDWSYVDSQVNRCRRLGEPYKLLMMTGGNCPKWIGGPWLNGAPIPWSTQNVAAQTKLIVDCGNRYGADPLCRGWHVTGGTRGSTSEELHPDAQWNNDAGMLAAYMQWTDVSCNVFPTQTIFQAISVQGRAKNYVPKLIAYGINRAPGRYAVKHNALKYKTKWADHDLLVIDSAKRGALMAFEFVQPQGNPNPAIETARRAAKAAGIKEVVTVDTYPGDLGAIR